MKREIKGMLTGLGVTFKTMTKPAVTVQYPHEREDPPTRARGVIALKDAPVKSRELRRILKAYARRKVGQLKPFHVRGG